MGLKEAKEAVEKVPYILKSGITKEEAESLKDSLGKLGCEINIVWIFIYTYISRIIKNHT